ncbi:MAG TPA: hypothetical protein PKJ47_01825 [Candidatus Limiplasma sp.]|nr:hypothetical protein [Candidatus Limiplasma sp.]
MRKWKWGVLLAVSLMLLALPAMAETHVFDNLFASIDIPETYITITPDNIANYTDWLQSHNLSTEEETNDMLARGVLLQCWTQEGDACFELTATQNDQTLNIFDVNEQNSSVRATYRLSHYPDNLFLDQGYEFSSADWKNTANGRFLVLRYIYRENGQIDHRGLMRRTIRNGYEITFDMRVYGRAVTNKDNTALNKIWESFKFVEIKPLPAAASAKVNISEAPPAETNEASFNLSGTAAEGVTFTAVVMGLSYPDPMVSTVEVGASGKFKLPIKLPKEGVFMVTVTADYNGEDVMELAYPVTYQRTLLTVNVTTDVPEQVTVDDFSILGTSTPGATIQVFVNDEEVTHKKVTTAGRFKIDLDTSKEGSYDVVLAFSKPGLADRRVNYSFTRSYSQNDMVSQLQSEAISPGYATLVKKIDGYDGRIMGYKCYVVEVSQSGNDWILKMALTKKGDGYSSILLVTTSEQPTVTAGTRVMMYGRCVGMSVPTNDATATDGQTAASDTESYPCFELLLLSDL